MKNSAEIKIQIDPSCSDPVILIRTAQKTQEVENIIHAIENSLNDEYPLIVCHRDNKMELLSQRDITRLSGSAGLKLPISGKFPVLISVQPVRYISVLMTEA